jgi:hypothetical protein
MRKNNKNQDREFTMYSHSSDFHPLRETDPVKNHEISLHQDEAVQ